MPLNSLHITIVWFYLLFALVLAGTYIYLSGGNRWVWWIVQVAPAIYLASFPFWKFRMERGFPWLVIFLLITLLTTMANMPVSSSIIILMKNIIFIAGIWAFFTYFIATESEVFSILKLLLFVACIQILWVFPQYFFVRSSRISQGLGTVEASDSVVGSFGGSMTGGGLTATFAFFQVCILIGLVSFRRYGVIKDRRRYIIFILLTFFPLLLTETKVIVVYFLLAAIILNASLIKTNFVKFVSNNIRALLLVVGLILSFQFYHWSAKGGGLIENLTSSLSYSFSEQSGHFSTQHGVMTRYQAVLFWWENGTDSLGHMLFGYGLGSSYSIPSKVSLLGPMASKFSPWELDKTGLTMLLWDVGVIGTLVVFAFLIHSSRHAKRFSTDEKLNAWQRALAQTLQVVFLMFCFSLVYRHDIPYAAPMMVIFMLSLGLLSYLSKSRYSGME